MRTLGSVLVAPRDTLQLGGKPGNCTTAGFQGSQLQRPALLSPSSGAQAYPGQEIPGFHCTFLRAPEERGCRSTIPTPTLCNSVYV